MQESFTHNAPIFEIEHSSVGDEDESADIDEQITNNNTKRYSAQPPEIAEEYKAEDGRKPFVTRAPKVLKNDNGVRKILSQYETHNR